MKTEIAITSSAPAKKRLSVSISGGKTSCFMAKWIRDNKAHEFDEVVYTFANTGQEHPETLEFLHKCETEWNLPVVWLEAVIDPRPNKGTRHKVVNYETADREGKVFEEMIKKYGVPNPTFQPCNRELKLAAMRSYLRSIGWNKGDYYTAIGIRIDEMDRVNGKMEEEMIVYPLIEWTKATKDMVILWWDRQPFNLNIPEHYGNCKTCWKKSKRKLLTIAVEHPEWFEWNARMESDYGFNGARTDDGLPRVFFRNHTSTIQLLEESKKPFELWRPKAINFDLFDYEMDAAGGCSESCEVY
jgi:3'-phosphoadenosine 5'-phosphosulfate sulfotransferase (PAPS reductase)/FAD synthetase